MARLGYHTTDDDCVSSSPADSVEEAIRRGLRLLESWDARVDSAWVRDDSGEVVWRGQRVDSVTEPKDL